MSEPTDDDQPTEPPPEVPRAHILASIADINAVHLTPDQRCMSIADSTGHRCHNVTDWSCNLCNRALCAMHAHWHANVGHGSPTTQCLGEYDTDVETDPVDE